MPSNLVANQEPPRDQNIMRGCTTVPPGPALAPLISAFCRASSALTLWLARGVARVASRAGTWREALEGVLTGCAAESSARERLPLQCDLISGRRCRAHSSRCEAATRALWCLGHTAGRLLAQAASRRAGALGCGGRDTYGAATPLGGGTACCSGRRGWFGGGGGRRLGALDVKVELSDRWPTCRERPRRQSKEWPTPHCCLLPPKRAWKRRGRRAAGSLWRPSCSSRRTADRRTDVPHGMAWPTPPSSPPSSRLPPERR